MKLRYCVDEFLVPKDGSIEILKKLSGKTQSIDGEIVVFPDVHYKLGARIASGTLVSSRDRLFPCMFGVENCGFTFGKITGLSSDEKQLCVDSFSEYSLSLPDYGPYEQYSQEYIINLFHEYLKNDYNSDASFYRDLGIVSIDEAVKVSSKILNNFLVEKARNSLGSLGGGNHFFEAHEVSEVVEQDASMNGVGVKEKELLLMLHTDSIAFGEYVMLTYSNLSEWFHLKGFKGFKMKMKFKAYQLKYLACRHKVLWRDPRQTLKLLFSQKDYRDIRAFSELGKLILFSFKMASLFGEMNRDTIIRNFMKVLEKRAPGVAFEKIASHSHDSMSIEDTPRGKCVVHRNGVQKVKGDMIYLLPSALGGPAYLVKNPKNLKAYHSSNHGTGRFLDKHLAREEFDEEGTLDFLQKRNVALFRVGKGNISEQNFGAFKDVDKVLEVMESYELGKRYAKTRPIAIIKG